jgi:hypothetical protein
MTRDAAAQAVHERLEHAVSAMPAFDVEAGWTSLAAQLEGPVAPVIPLRPRRPRRFLALAVAAAVFIGGSALAMVRHGTASDVALGPAAAPGTAWSSGPVTGPHTHPAFSGAPPALEPSAPTSHSHGGGTPQVPPPPPSSPGGGTSDGGSGDHHGGPTHVDAPDDTDHGTGNDGQHDDNGQGNDTQGQDQGGGSGGGQGSGQGSGDQGSGGAQGSADRGSDPSQGSQGNGQANGHGQ